MKGIGLIIFLISLLGFQFSFAPVAKAPDMDKPVSSISKPILEEQPLLENSPVINTKEEVSPIASFAKCLTENGAVFYGSSTCGHCKAQKDLFGDAMEFVNYVECNPRAVNSAPEKCIAANIEAYPTWIIGDQKIIGMQRLEQLAEKTPCEI